MGHQLSTFYWSTDSFSGVGQLNEGPFHIGVVNKIFRARVRGAINFQGETITATSVAANLPAFGLQIGPHGFVPDDVGSSPDDDSWLVRRQTGSADTMISWAPASDDAAQLASLTVADDWAGQLALSGADMDVYLLIQTTTTALPNFNTFGSTRLWWN